MIICSSFKSFNKCSAQIAENQIRAKKSWDRLGAKVVYFNSPQSYVSGRNTSFISSDSKPDIQSMATLLGSQSDWGCIVNADIVLGDGITNTINTMTLCLADCAVSKRYTIPDSGNVHDARLMRGDYGLDFFIATPKVWQHVASKIPKDFRLGKIVWDTWMVCFFVTEYYWSCYDLTPSKVVFHPNHGEREDQGLDVPKDQYLTKSLWPPFVIGFDSSLKPA